VIAPEQMLCPRDYQRFCVPGLPPNKCCVPGTTKDSVSPDYRDLGTTSPETREHLELAADHRHIPRQGVLKRFSDLDCMGAGTRSSKCAVSPKTPRKRRERQKCCVPGNVLGDRENADSTVAFRQHAVKVRWAGRNAALFRCFLLTTGFTAAAKISALTD
jgi:hypothetical protein